MSTILITLCARGGSKGIPGKNIKVLNGKPLIAYTIEAANQFKRIHKNASLALSTDSGSIIDVAAEYGLVTNYKRPPSLAGDSVGKIETIKDVLLYEEKKSNVRYDYVLDMDITSPLRNLSDLINAYKIIESNKEAINLFSVNPANRNPYFNMVEIKDNGFYAQVKNPEGAVLTRQSAPTVYDINASFYFYKRRFFDLGYKGAITNKSLVYVVPHVCFDLDHPIDFEILSFLLENNKLDFNL